MVKDVADQTSGRHTLRFRAMVTETSQASLAKIEVRTAGQSWDRKLQVYFGSFVRLNHSPTGAAVTLVPATEFGRWYDVRLELDLDAGTADAWVDGLQVATDVPIGPGPITALALSGWDQPGAVTIDDLVGSRH